MPEFRVQCALVLLPKEKSQMHYPEVLLAGCSLKQCFLKKARRQSFLYLQRLRLLFGTTTKSVKFFLIVAHQSFCLPFYNVVVSALTNAKMKTTLPWKKDTGKSWTEIFQIQYLLL